jgi:hypothetical protein
MHTRIKIWINSSIAHQRHSDFNKINTKREDINVKNVKIIKRPGVGEIIAPHYEIRVGNDTIAFIYQPLACHSYNIVKEGGYVPAWG